MRDRNQQSKPEIEAENPRDRAKPREHEEQRQTTHKTKKVHKELPSWTHKKQINDSIRIYQQSAKHNCSLSFLILNGEGRV